MSTASLFVGMCSHSCPILLWKKLFHCLIAVAGSKAINSSQLLVNEMIILRQIIEYKDFYSYSLVGLIIIILLL